MTPAQAIIYNQAIKDAVSQYHNGIGAIKSLTKRITVTVEHVGRSTIQEVEVEDC